MRRADEVDPYKKPAELLELSPKGLVPALRLNNYDPPRALNESTIIIDFLEECVGLRAASARHCMSMLLTPSPQISDERHQALLAYHGKSLPGALRPV